MTTEATDPICRVCGKPKSIHNYRHAFVGTSSPMELREVPPPSHDDDSGHPSSQGPVRSLLGGDPILRLALIRRGIITPEDLAAVEEELRGAGIATAEPLGQPRDR